MYMYMCIHLKISIVPIIRKRLTMKNTVYMYFELCSGSAVCVPHTNTHSVNKDSPLFM